MNKIPTLFRRPNPAGGPRFVYDEITPGCEWVAAGEGVATRKWDGTCVLIKPNKTVWVRREVKRGKEFPLFFETVEADPATGKTFGWEPASRSGFDKYIGEAIRGLEDDPRWVPGTYELCGPRINGNPERLEVHELIRHGAWEWPRCPRDFDGLCDALTDGIADRWEGIVFWHPDGRKAKIKRRDFDRNS